MIEHSTVERACGCDEAASGTAIAVAGTSVTTWMIVGKHDPSASVLRGVGNDLPHRKGRARLIALVARDMEAARFVVHVRDPKALALRVELGEAAREELARGIEAVELEGAFGALIPHAGLTI